MYHMSQMIFPRLMFIFNVCLRLCLVIVHLQEAVYVMSRHLLERRHCLLTLHMRHVLSEHSTEQFFFINDRRFSTDSGQDAEREYS